MGVCWWLTLPHFVFPVAVSEADAKATALTSPRLQALLGGKPPRQGEYVPGWLGDVVG